MIKGEMKIHEEPYKSYTTSHENTPFNDEYGVYWIEALDEGQRAEYRELMLSEIESIKKEGFIIGAKVKSLHNSEKIGTIIKFPDNIKDGFNYNGSDITPLEVEWPASSPTGQPWSYFYMRKDLILVKE